VKSSPAVPQRELSQLDRFAREFRDEAHLRTILRDLLIRAGGKGVRITHGTGERGKDIVFYKPGGLSSDVLYACVVKKERITGRADSSSGAQTVLNQALQAINESYVEPSTGRQDRVHTAYIICPNECTPEAVASIQQQLREQARRVEFICGIDLIQLFQTHWPDFLRFDSAILTRFLSTLKAGLSIDNALIALLTRNNANLGLKPFEKFYVPNQLELRLDRLRAPGIRLPWANAFSQYMTMEELEDLVIRLRFWKQVLRSPELTGGEPATLKENAAHIDELCRNAKRYWEQSLKTGRSRKKNPPNPRDKTKEPEERQLGLPYHILNSYGTFVAIVEKVNQQLHKIDKASQEVSKSSKHLNGATAALLGDPDFRVTSIGYDYLNVIPGLLTQEQGRRLRVDPAVLFSGSRAVLLTGPPGSGKTSFCRWHTLRAIEQFSRDSSEPLPVYVSAHRIMDSAQTFEEAFLGSTDIVDLWPTDHEKAKVAILLFVDGLDEIADRNQQHRIMQILQSGIEKYPRLNAIVTSRPYVWGAWLNWLPRLHLADLELVEQRLLAERWLDETSHIEAFFKELQCSPALQKLMGVPLLATLILNLYRRTPAIPENKASLYRAFVDLYCGGWNVAKGLPKAGRFPNEQKLRPLPGLAYRMHLSHKADCGEPLFAKVVQDTMPALSNRAADLLGEIIQDGILVRVGHDLVFAHLSFQEYLAAQFLASDPKGRRPSQALSHFLRGEDWWKEILEFYLISRDDPTTLDDWILRASGGAGTRQSRDDEEDQDNQDIIGRLNTLARVLSETFPGYVPKFNQKRKAKNRGQIV
jgi:hypothetical protein